MRNRIIAGFTLLSFMALPFPALALSGGAVEMESGSGQVLLETSHGTWVDAASAPVQVGQTLRTGQDGQAIVAFAGGDRVRLSANSELTILGATAGQTDLLLHKGRVIGQAEGRLKVLTDDSETVASKGQFVLEAGKGAATLEVLEGNARLAPLQAGTAPSYPLLSGLPDGIRADFMAFGPLAWLQAVGDFDQIAQKGGKNAPLRDVRADQNVGGEDDDSPDQDLPENNNAENTDGTDTSTDTNTETSTETSTDTDTETGSQETDVESGDGNKAGAVIGGVFLLGGLIYTLTRESDPDGEVFLVSGSPQPQPPSPSLP